VKRLLALVPWIALLVFAVLEVSAHAWTRARVPAPSDWRAAAAFVRGQYRARDLIVAAPAWSDPLLRSALGDRIDLAMAGRSDLAGYERLWALSIRGALPDEAPARPPALERAFGRVRVLRWDLGPSRVLHDFVQALPTAEVTWISRKGEGRCDYRKRSAPRGGGLGNGVLPPRQRFGCDAGVRAGWTGQVVMEDLDLQPRYCVYHPPAGDERIRIAFRDVPLGQRLQLYAGLYYEHERMRQGGPIELHVSIDGRPAGVLTHRDGDGWKPLAIATAGGRGEVAFEVRAREPRRRHFCWAASTRAGASR
jgi:hypothetical protein